MIDRIKEKGFEKTEVEKFKKSYLQHILERANYYEKFSFEMNERHIGHNPLLYHNLTSAPFLGDLIKKFKEEGWEIIDANKAYKDNIFDKIPDPTFAGESLIYFLVKQSGNYEGALRYRAEDGRYEHGKMYRLGLQ